MMLRPRPSARPAVRQLFFSFKPNGGSLALAFYWQLAPRPRARGLSSPLSPLTRCPCNESKRLLRGKGSLLSSVRCTTMSAAKFTTAAYSVSPFADKCLPASPLPRWLSPAGAFPNSKIGGGSQMTAIRLRRGTDGETCSERREIFMGKI